MSSPLNKICNQVLSSGIFSEYFKYSDIKSIYKNGDKHIMTNSRLYYPPSPKLLRN